MKTLIWKELREQRVLAIAAFLAFLFLYFTTSQHATELARQAANGQLTGDRSLNLQPLLSGAFLTTSAILCGIFGGLLGWQQAFSERHRDLRAYLLHRPVTVSAIFASKVIAGVSLYILVAGVSLIGFVLWVQKPGHIAAPFEWSMALPGVAICVAGITGYFAGMLVSLRAVRWHGSRALPLIVPVLLMMTCKYVNHFSVVITLVLIGCMALSLSAWGAFKTGGHYDGQPIVAKGALTASLAVSLTVICVTGLGFILSRLQNADQREWSYRQMTKDGTIYKTAHSNGSFEALDLNGHPLLNAAGSKMEEPEFSKLLAQSSSVYVITNRPYNLLENSPDHFVLWKGSAGVLWYYSNDYGRLFGYDAASKQMIGSFGPEGFSKDAIGKQRFSSAASTGYWNLPFCLTTDKAAYEIDLRNRLAKTIFTAEEGDRILAVSGGAPNYFAPQNALVVTEKTIHIFNTDHKQIFELPYKPGFPQYPQIQIIFLETTNTFALWLEPDYQANSKAKGQLPIHIDWFNTKDGITQQKEIPSNYLENHLPSFLERVLYTAVPPILSLGIFLAPGNGVGKDIVLLGLGFPIVYALIGLWISRRYSLSRRSQIGWGTFHLLTGLPGLLAFICVRDWPRREKCGACGKPHSVEHEQCEYCHTNFPPPEKNGVEIFEAVTAE